MNITDLPVEVLLRICRFIKSPKDSRALNHSCRGIRSALSFADVLWERHEIVLLIDFYPTYPPLLDYLQSEVDSIVNPSNQSLLPKKRKARHPLCALCRYITTAIQGGHEHLIRLMAPIVALEEFTDSNAVYLRDLFSSLLYAICEERDFNVVTVALDCWSETAPIVIGSLISEIIGGADLIVDEKLQLVELTLEKFDPSYNRNELLRMAVASNELEIVARLLLDPRVDPSAQNNRAIRCAVDEENLPLVQLLLDDTRIDPSVNNCELIYTAHMHEFGEGIIVKMLTHPRTDASGRDNWPIRLAVELGNLELVEYLLQKPRVDPCVHRNSPLRIAIRKGHVSMIERFLQDPRIDPSAYGNSALREAVAFDNMEIIEIFLKDPRVEGSSRGKSVALCVAVKHRHLQVVKRLLQDPQISPLDDNLSALRIAAYQGDLEIVELFLNNPKMNSKVNFNNVLVRAAESGHLSVVERLLQDPRVDPCADNYLALVKATWKHHLHVIQYMLQDARVDKSVAAPLVFQKAWYENFIEIIDYLLRECLADLSAMEPYVISMGFKKRMNLVKRLLNDSRFDPSCNQNAMLIAAAKVGQIEFVKELLLDSRVDPSDNQNMAIRQASSRGHLNVVNQLLQDPRVDPSANNNEAIRLAYHKNSKSAKRVVKRLLNDPRVDSSVIPQHKLEQFKRQRQN